MLFRSVKKRLDVYHAQTEPLVKFYGDWGNTGAADAPKYIKVSGVGSVDSITSAVFAGLDSVKK